MERKKRAGRVLILGVTGQVGRELAEAFADCELVCADRNLADLSRPESLRPLLRDLQPYLVLNAAAYTAVDRAESEPELADLVNHRAAGVLAEEAERAGAVLVHYSTDYVFDGTGTHPWRETDEPAPLNVYGRTKLAGERAVAAASSRFVILRTTWVYGPHGHNFLRTMLRLGRERDQLRIVNDQIGAPTTARALARATRAVIDAIEQQQGSGWTGIYHATCAGETTWCDFARAIFALASKRAGGAWARVDGIPTSDYPTPAVRPRYSVLDGGKLEKRFGVRLPHWREALEGVLERTLLPA